MVGVTVVAPRLAARYTSHARPRPSNCGVCVCGTELEPVGCCSAADACPLASGDGVAGGAAGSRGGGQVPAVGSHAPRL